MLLSSFFLIIFFPRKKRYKSSIKPYQILCLPWWTQKSWKFIFEFTDFHSVLFVTFSIWDEFAGCLSFVLFCFSFDFFWKQFDNFFLLFCLCYVYFGDRKRRKKKKVDLQTINYWTQQFNFSFTKWVL